MHLLEEETVRCWNSKNLHHVSALSFSTGYIRLKSIALLRGLYFASDDFAGC
jgi:hypothetical protein